METFTIIAYCASDDARKKLGLEDDIQTKVGMAQIMTTGLVAAKFFGGNHSLAQTFLYEHRYFHYKLSSSQFNRRFHSIPESLFNELAKYFSYYAKMTNESFEFAIDSFPVPACDNIRIHRSRLFNPKQCRGLVASKRRFFHGVRLHMIASITRQPVEFKILPGNVSDISGAKMLSFNLPSGSTVYADKGYSDYKHEDFLKQSKNIEFEAIRKSNSSRLRHPEEELMIKRKRKSIETMFSSIARLMPKSIHAVTSIGFIKKVICFVLAYSVSCFKVTT